MRIALGLGMVALAFTALAIPTAPAGDEAQEPAPLTVRVIVSFIAGDGQ